MSKISSDDKEAKLSVLGTGAYSGAGDDPRIRAVLDALAQQGFGKPVQWPRVAANVNLSASRLRHIFRHEVGESPARYVKRLRLQTAKMLLETSFLTIKEIMARVGINSHFAHDYKRIFGQTPSQSRRRSRRAA